MIPHVLSPFQAWVAALYWGRSWTELSADEVQEALDWYYRR